MLTNHKGESALDRATVEVDAPDDSDDNRILHTSDSLDHATNHTDAHLSKRKRLSGKVKSVLHVHNDQLNVAGNSNYVTLAASPNAVSEDARLDDDASPEPPAQGFKSLVQHPIDTIKAKTDRKTNKEVAANFLSPEVTHAQDVELIHAQDSLDSSKSENEKLQACKDLETLKKARQDLFVRWTMDRHVLKLRQLGGKGRHGQSRRESGTRDLDWKMYFQQVRNTTQVGRNSMTV